MKKSQSLATTLPERFTPQFWQEADQRLAIVREIRRRVTALKADSGADSAQKQTLCERAVFLALQLETQEREAVENGRIDLGSYTQGCNALLGLLRALGLQKHAKPVNGDLKTYLTEITK